MENTIRIRTAGPADASVIAALAKEIWTQHYLPIIGQQQVDYMLDKFQSQRAIQTDIRGGYTYFIAELDGEPSGYSAVRQDRGVFLSKFYVKQTARGRGLGKAMMGEILQYAKKASAARIWLTCNKHNENTLAIYDRLGFNRISEVVTDIGGGFVMDDYILEKPLFASSPQQLVENALRTRGLSATADLLAASGFSVHPSVAAVVVEGSRGLKNSFRADSDLDIGLVLDPAEAPTAQLCTQIIHHSLSHWQSDIELDLAVLFDKNACGIVCLQRSSANGLACGKGTDCLGIFKLQKGFSGFVPNLGLTIEMTLPALYIPLK